MGDFVLILSYADSVAKLSLSAFKDKYQSWCKKEHYKYSESKAEQIHEYVKTTVCTLPMTEAVVKLHNEMDSLASRLSEYKLS